METLLEWMGGYIWLTAFVLGAAHALQPGHGKTIVAAYLVGSRGTVKDALFLGIVVTLTHTLVIYVLAAIAGWSSLYWDRTDIEQYLGAFAALLILLVGISLLWGQWLRQKRGSGEGGHAHSHGAGHSHSHSPAATPSRDPGPAKALAAGGNHDHAHLPGFSHRHPEPGQMTSLSKVFLLGISGGIVPCPEGLAVFLASVAGGRIETGVLLVMVFSLGLAATLVAVGVLFIKASQWFGNSMRGGVWGNRVAWISAVLITGVGIGYFTRYLLQFLA